MASTLTKKAIVPTLALAGLGFSLYLAWAYFTQIADLLRAANLGLVTICLLLLILANISVAWLFSELTSQELQRPVPRAAFVGAFLLAQVGKYVPGRVWGLVMQKIALGNDLTTRATLVANFELTLISMTCILGTGLACFLLSTGHALAAGTVLLLTACIMSMTALTRLTGRLLNLGQRVFPKWQAFLPQVQSSSFVVRSAFTPVVASAYVLLYALGWILLLWLGFSIEIDQSLRFMAAQSAAQVVGILSMLPAGIGVREALLLGFSGWLEMEIGKAAALVVATRLGMVFVDLVSMPIGAALLYFSRRR